MPRITVVPQRPRVVYGIRRPSPPIRVAPLVHAPQTVSVNPATIQRALAAKGFYVGSIDGIVGPMTRRAIASFQARAGLPVTGQISASLVNALQR